MITTESLLANNSTQDLNSRYNNCYLLAYYKEQKGAFLVDSIYNPDNAEHDSATFISGTFLYKDSKTREYLTPTSLNCDIKSLLLVYSTPTLGVINTNKGAVWSSKVVKRQWRRGLYIGNITTSSYTDNLSVESFMMAYSILTNEYVSMSDGIVSILSNHTDSVGINNTIALAVLSGRSYISVFYRDIEVGYINPPTKALILYYENMSIIEEIREMKLGINIGVDGCGY